MRKPSQTVIVSARVSPHLRAMLQDEAKTLGVSVSSIMEDALLAWLEKRRGAPRPVADLPAPTESMTITEAIQAFHKVLRVDDSKKDVVARSWLEFREQEAARRRGNVVALRRKDGAAS
jgi:hypothetical protein